MKQSKYSRLRKFMMWGRWKWQKNSISRTTYLHKVSVWLISRFIHKNILKTSIQIRGRFLIVLAMCGCCEPNFATILLHFLLGRKRENYYHYSTPCTVSHTLVHIIFCLFVAKRDHTMSRGRSNMFLDSLPPSLTEDFLKIDQGLKKSPPKSKNFWGPFSEKFSKFDGF